jgi:hypothetical protein
VSQNAAVLLAWTNDVHIFLKADKKSARSHLVFEVEAQMARTVGISYSASQNAAVLWYANDSNRARSQWLRQVKALMAKLYRSVSPATANVLKDIMHCTSHSLPTNWTSDMTPLIGAEQFAAITTQAHLFHNSPSHV